jgi:hypothetical protein
MVPPQLPDQAKREAAIRRWRFSLRRRAGVLLRRQSGGGGRRPPTDILVLAKMSLENGYASFVCDYYDVESRLAPRPGNSGPLDHRQRGVRVSSCVSKDSSKAP